MQTILWNPFIVLQTKNRHYIIASYVSTIRKFNVTENHGINVDFSPQYAAFIMNCTTPYNGSFPKSNVQKACDNRLKNHNLAIFLKKIKIWTNIYQFYSILDTLLFVSFNKMARTITASIMSGRSKEKFYFFFCWQWMIGELSNCNFLWRIFIYSFRIPCS